MALLACPCGGTPSVNIATGKACCGGCGAFVSAKLWDRMIERLGTLDACCRDYSNQLPIEGGDGVRLIRCVKCERRHLLVGEKPPVVKKAKKRRGIAMEDREPLPREKQTISSEDVGSVEDVLGPETT